MTLLLGLFLGAVFGAILQLSGASSYTKIIGTLRLKDFTIMKLIMTAIGIGMIGVHALDAVGAAHMKVKDLYVPGIVIAGGTFGVGFAITGYCPGTALAAAAEGKPDAWMTIVGGLFGALAFAFLWPDLESSLASFGGFGPVTIQGSFGINGLLIALPLGILSLWAAAKLPRPGGT